MSSLVSCPQCGGHEFDRRGTLQACRFCGAEFNWEDEDRFTWTCGDCGYHNETGSTFCGSCGEPLKKICFECGKLIRSDLSFCPACGMAFLPEEKLLYHHQDRVSSNFLTDKRLYCRSLTGKGIRQLRLEEIQEIAIVSVLGAGYAIAIKGHTGETYEQPDGSTYQGNALFTQMNVPTREEASLLAEAIQMGVQGQAVLVRYPRMSCLGRIFATALAVVALLSYLG